MTELQARELREFLSNELIDNGFSDIVDEIDFRLLDSFNDNDRPQQNEREMLLFFLNQAIAIFDGISNKDIGALVSRINKNLQDGSIEGIEVLPIGKGLGPIDLAELPDYSEISKVLQEVLSQITNDNDTNGTDDNS